MLAIKQHNCSVGKERMIGMAVLVKIVLSHVTRKSVGQKRIILTDDLPEKYHDCIP